MAQHYYYAVGTVFKTLNMDGEIIEDCAFLDKNSKFTDRGLTEAIVYADESQALKIAQQAHGRIVRVHHEYVEQLDIDIKN